MTLEYQRVVDIVLENPEFTARERESLAAEYDRAGCYESLKPFARRKFEGAYVAYRERYRDELAAKEEAERVEREAVWEAASLSERLRVEGMRCAELEALEGSDDPVDVAARERVHVALEAIVQIAVMQGRVATSKTTTEDIAMGAIRAQHQAEERLESVERERDALRSELQRTTQRFIDLGFEHERLRNFVATLQHGGAAADTVT